MTAVLSLAACGPGVSVSNGTSNHGATSAATSGAGSSGGVASGTGPGSSGTSTGGSSTGGAGTTSGSSSGGVVFAGCPVDRQPCTPANICNAGCTPDGGLCVDELTANNFQTGVSCATNAVCEGTTCLAGSGPQIPNQNGGVLTQPNIVIMTFDSDPNQQAIENWAVWIADGGYLPATIGQYGVGNGTVQFVRLKDAMPNEDEGAIQQYLQTPFNSDPTMPAFAQNNIDTLVFPNAWAGTSVFCQSQGGYHAYFRDSSGNYPIYAVVAACRNDLQGDIEVAGSHEVAEATTDPYVGSWTFDNTSTGWAFIGGEVGDMCESNSDYYLTPDGVFAAQYIWSNSAAKAGQVPCQPWPDGLLYVDVLGPPAMMPATPGTTVNIPLTGWASGPTGSWALVAEDAFFGVDFQTSPTLSQQSVGPGEQVMAQLNIPQALPGEPALGGLSGAAWIFSAVSDSAYYGSAAVGVPVSCETSGDCSNESSSCSLTAGVGSCGYNACAKTRRSPSRSARRRAPTTAFVCPMIPTAVRSRSATRQGHSRSAPSAVRRRASSTPGPGPTAGRAPSARALRPRAASRCARPTVTRGAAPRVRPAHTWGSITASA